MSFELSEDHEEFRRTVRDFAEKEIAPHAAQWDRDHHFPVDVVQKMGELGSSASPPPRSTAEREDGDFTSLCVAIEEIGRVDQSIGITLEAAVGLGINPILTFGTDEQKQTWLPDLVEGRTLAGFGLTEPGAGSDAGATKTKAELRDGEWVVNGSKQFITNSGSEITSLVTVTARTGERATTAQGRDLDDHRAERHRGLHRREGLRQARLARLGHPPAELQRRPRPGVQPARRAWPWLRPVPGHPRRRSGRDRRAGGRLHPGLPRPERAVRRRADHLRRTHRAQAGRRLPDRRPRGDAGRRRQLTYQAAWMKDAGKPMKDFKHAAAIAKLYATESAVTATRIATQVFGGYGFMEEYPVARFYRDAKVLEIGEGTSEVQRMLIARGLGLPVNSSIIAPAHFRLMLDINPSRAAWCSCDGVALVGRSAPPLAQ